MNNIQLNIVANAQFQQVYAEVAKLKSAMLSLQKSAVGGPFTPGNVASIKQAQQAFDQAVLSTRAFNIEHVAMGDSVAKFGKQLQAGQLSLSNYYKIWRDNAKGTSAELDALATSQARLNRSVAIADPLRPGYAKLVTDINGVVTAQEKQIFYQKALNTALQQGSIKLIDFGKNTQWMGRQLTVGLTMPLAMFGAGVSQLFLTVDKELTRMQKVYGTGLVQPTQAALKQIRSDVTALGTELARTLGVSVQETASMAADLAATGLEGAKLVSATREAIRMSVLGELDHQKAMQATVALQNVYKLSTTGLTEAVNFLNAVENQTSTSLQDLVDAIPRVGPVVAQLGGSFKDTAAMMVAMKEAGVPAAQGANAIKSAISSLINPTTAAQKAFKQYNIDLKSIATTTGGNPVMMLKTLADQMKNLDRLSQAQLIEKMFGKFQYARVQALLDNINKSGSQTATVFKLMGASGTELANLATNELKQQTESASGKFKRMTESIKADLLPIGQTFLNSFTSIGNVIDKIVNAVKSISKFMGPVAGILGKVFGTGLAGLLVVGPLIMLTGLFANLIGNILRGANSMRMFKQGMDAALPTENKFLAGLQGMRNFYQELDKSQIASRNQMDLMPEAITTNAKAFQILTVEIAKLTEQFTALAIAQREAMTGSIPSTVTVNAGTVIASQMRLPGFTEGGIVPGTGDSDSVPAMLTPGELVIPKKLASGKGPLSIIELMKRQLKGRRTDRAHQGQELTGSDVIRSLEEQERKGITVASASKDSINKLVSNFVVDQDTRINQNTNTYRGNPRRGATGEAVAADLWHGQYATNFAQIQNAGTPVNIQAAAKITALLNEYEANLLLSDEQFKKINSENNKFITSKVFEKLEADIKSGTVTLTEAEKKLLDEMKALDSQFNTATRQADRSKSGVATGRTQERFAVYSGTSDPTLSSYTKISSQETASMALAIEANYAQEKQNLIEASASMGKQSALAIIDGIKAGVARTMNEISRSASNSKETTQAAANIANGAVDELNNPKYVKEAQAGGAQIAQAEIKGVQQELPAAMAVGTQLGAAEIAGAGGGSTIVGSLGGKTSNLWSKLKGNSWLGKKAIASGKPIEEVGNGFGFKSGMGMMMGSMALNAMPSKIGGSDLSGAKGIASSALSVGSMVSMIPGLNLFTPEIMGAVAALSAFSWLTKKASADKAKFEADVKSTYSNLEKTPDKFIEKIQEQITLSDTQGKKYKDLSVYGKVYGDTILKAMDAVGSGKLKGQELSNALALVSSKTANSTTQLKLLKAAAQAAGDTTMSTLISELEKVGIKGTLAMSSISTLMKMKADGIDPLNFISTYGASGVTDKKAIGEAYDTAIKSVQDSIVAAKKSISAGDTANAQQKALKDKIKNEELIKKNLNDQLKTMQDQAKVIQQQNDYLNKQTDLTNQIKQAEITGNYIQAAQLRSVKQQETAKYAQQNAIDAKQGQVDSQQAVVDALNAQLQALQDAANATAQTAANTANLKSLQDQLNNLIADKKAAMGAPDGTPEHPINVQVSNVDKKGLKGGPTAITPGISSHIVSGADLEKAGVSKTGATRLNPYGGTYTGQTITYQGKKYKVLDQIPYTDQWNLQPITKADGGHISGPGSSTSDSIPAYLSNGEYVIRASSVAKYGKGTFDALNAGHYSGGGMALNPLSMIMGLASQSFGKFGNSFINNFSEAQGSAPLFRLLTGKKETNWDYLGAASLMAGPELGLVSKLLEGGDLSQFAMEKAQTTGIMGGATTVNLTVNATGVTDPKVITQMAHEGVLNALKVSGAKANKGNMVRH